MSSFPPNCKLQFEKRISNENLLEFREIIKKLDSVKNLRIGIHGINHLLRVLLLTMMICDSLNISNRDKKIAWISATYHDIGRNNDQHDLIHGMLSWRKAKQYIKDDFNDDEMKIIKYIIENHCIPDKIAYENINNYNISNQSIAYKLLNIVKDADSLDIIRLKVFEEKYLRYVASKSFISFAHYLNELEDGILLL